MNQMVTQIWWFNIMVVVVTIPNYLHILADILYVGKITPVDAIQQISQATSNSSIESFFSHIDQIITLVN